MLGCILAFALAEPSDENALTFSTFKDWFLKPQKRQQPVQQERVMKFAESALRTASESEDFAVNFLTGLLLKSGVTNNDLNDNKLLEELTAFVNHLSSSNSFIDATSYNQMKSELEDLSKQQQNQPQPKKEKKPKQKQPENLPKKQNSAEPPQWNFQQPIGFPYPMNVPVVPLQYYVPQYQQLNSDRPTRRHHRHHRSHKHA